MATAVAGKTEQRAKAEGKARAAVETRSQNRSFSTASELLRMQSSVGNQLTLELLTSAYEGLRLPGPMLQRKCSCGGPEGGCQCPVLQRKTRAHSRNDDEGVQEIPSIVRDVLKGEGRPLEASVRDDMEQRFGQDFSRIRIHTDASAARSADAVNALAYTVGRSVVFGPGQYAPETDSGRRLLSHELAHTIQQAQASTSSALNGGAALEAEADRAAEHAVRGIRTPKLGGARVSLQRDQKQPTSDQPIDLGPIFRIGPFDGKPNEAVIRKELIGHGFNDAQSLGESQAVSAGPDTWSFMHPKYGEIAHVQISADSEGGQTLYILGGYSVGRIAKPGSKPTRGAGPLGGEKQAPAGGPRQTPGTPSQGPESGPKQGARQNEQSTQNVPGVGQQAPGAQPLPSDKLTKLKALPDAIKSMLGGEQKFTPDKYDQLLRIAAKLQQLSPQDLDLYKLIAKYFTNDLDAFEKSIDAFTQFKQQIIAQAKANPQAQRKPQATPQDADKQELQKKLADTWKNFDEKKFATFNSDQKEQLARQIGAEQANLQLEHMATHPGETVAGAVEGAVRVDQVVEGMADDLREVIDGNANGYARLGALAGFLGKDLGWIAAVAGLMFVVLLFVPGVNVVELGTIALVTGVAAMSLAAIESEARYTAAGQAKTPEQFQTQTTKAAAAQASFMAQAALMAITLALKLVLKIPLGGRLQNVGNALKMARNALAKGGGGTEFEALRSQVLDQLGKVRPGLSEALTDQGKVLTDLSNQVKGMSGKDLLNQIASADPKFKDLGFSPEQGKAMQTLAATDEGKNLPEQFRQQLAKALEDAPAEAQKRLEAAVKNVDQIKDEVQKAKTPEELEAALKNGEKLLSPEESAKQAAEANQEYVKQRLEFERFKNMSDQEVKSAALDDPQAADELLRRYRAMKVPQLEKLAKGGDGTAKYVLDEKRAGYKTPAQFDLRTTNVGVVRKLVARVQSLRTASGLPKTPTSGGTFGSAETNLPASQTEFDAGSPKTKAGAVPPQEEVPRHYKPSTKITQAQFHAEEELVNRLRQVIQEAQLTNEQMKGKTVWMAIEQEVCPTCKSGLGEPGKAAGVLQQFSRDYPNVTIEFTDIDTYTNTYRVWRIRGGEFVR